MYHSKENLSLNHPTTPLLFKATPPRFPNLPEYRGCLPCLVRLWLLSYSDAPAFLLHQTIPVHSGCQCYQTHPAMWRTSAFPGCCPCCFAASRKPYFYMVKSNCAPLLSSLIFTDAPAPVLIFSSSFSSVSAFSSRFSFRASSSFFFARFSSNCSCNIFL